MKYLALVLIPLVFNCVVGLFLKLVLERNSKANAETNNQWLVDNKDMLEANERFMIEWSKQ